MSDAAPKRVRIDLTPPQAVPQTSGLLFEPRSDRGLDALVLAPGAGSDLLHPVLLEVGKGLAEAGHPVLLFNFPFTEAGRKRPDPFQRLERAFVDAVDWLRERLGHDREVILGGRSMGGRVASHLAATAFPTSGLVLLGYPLHARRRRSGDEEDPRLRTEHWPDLHVPMLFVQGERDALCDFELLQRERGRVPGDARTDVHVVEGADHAFNVRARDGRTPAAVLSEVRETVVDWIAQLDRAPAA